MRITFCIEKVCLRLCLSPICCDKRIAHLPKNPCELHSELWLSAKNLHSIEKSTVGAALHSPECKLWVIRGVLSAKPCKGVIILEHVGLCYYVALTALRSVAVLYPALTRWAMQCRPIGVCHDKQIGIKLQVFI